MTARRAPLSSKVMARLAVAALFVSVIALGGLALWSSLVIQNEARGLGRVGVQTTGQVRALQALYVVRVETDELEDDYSQERLDRLRTALRDLQQALDRMADGDAPEVTRVAEAAEPLARQLSPAVERFLADPRSDIHSGGEAGDDTAEDDMEEVVEELEALLNDSAADPADLLTRKLDGVQQTGRAVSTTTLILVPLGLLLVAACGSLLGRYRRRSESAMQAALAQTALEARTDQLTELPNRRALLEELERRIEMGRPFTVALADLNGFKQYNDTYGHPAGDALLRRLGRKLAVAWEGHGFAARLGGDEFCVIADNLAPDALQALLHRALAEAGEGFEIGCVSGLAGVPTEAADPSAALRLADTRLYAAKAVVHAQRHVAWRQAEAGAGPAPGVQLTLARLIEQQYPGLGSHMDRVTHLAVRCADELGLPADQIVSIERAAQLYDIGKVALPAAILTKGGALTDDEEEFMRRHSVIGERLLTGIDDLAPVAAVVRATHERWDGEGYPDKLAGEDIPVGARIIAVVDAFCAMTADRPGAPSRAVDDALAELDRGAGRQFDPEIVAVVAHLVRGGVGGPQPSAPAGSGPTRVG
jgi:diguanylate cyclase (GGDEF)-like protein